MVAVSSLFSCSKEIVDNEREPVLSSTVTINIDNSLDIDYAGNAPASELRLYIVSESDWCLSMSDTRAKTDWITPSSINGPAGTSTVMLTITENISRDKRVAYIKLSNSSSSTTFVYTQKQYEPANLTLSISKLEVSSEAVRETFTLESALDWTLNSSDESICTVSPIRGTAGTQTVTVSITGNTSTERERTATLTAQSGYETKSIKVIQEHKKTELNIDRGIRTLDDLCRFRDAVNAGESISEWKYNGEINLLADIDLSYIDEWHSIGTDYNPFNDTFNGNGFSVKNMKITAGDDNDHKYGFFGKCVGGIIKNLVLKDVSSSSYGICGELEPKQYPVKIINCTVSGYVEVSPFGCCVALDGYSQYVNIMDCTNKAITRYPIIRGNTSMTTISSCANEGIYCDKYYSKYIEFDTGYRISEELFKAMKKLGILSIDAFIDYVGNYLKELRIGFGDYEDCNDNFIELASQSQSIEKLSIKIRADRETKKYYKRASEVIDMFRDIKLLECEMNSFGTYYDYDAHIYLKNVKPKLEKLTIKFNDHLQGGLFLAYPADEIFPILKRVECYTGVLNNSCIPSSCKELVIADILYHSDLAIKNTQLEYIEVSAYLNTLDVSKTNLGNSTYEYPLKYLSKQKTSTLILKNGWKINGINKNVNYNYINPDTVIEYVE